MYLKDFLKLVFFEQIVFIITKPNSHNIIVNWGLISLANGYSLFVMRELPKNKIMKIVTIRELK